MAVRKQTIKQQIDAIQRAAPKRDLATGMMYSRKDQLTKQYRKIIVHGLFVSDAGTFMVRPHMFDAKENKTRNPKQWSAWLSKNYGDILINILDGMANKTGKDWRLYRIIGWTPHGNTKPNSTATHKKRNKTES